MRLPAILFTLALAGRALAAQDNVTRAQELERRGDFAGAVTIWRAQIAAKPNDLTALLGLERSLTPLGRLGEMADAVQAAVRSEPSSGLLGLAVRVWTAARQPDSARAAVERWSRLEPTSEMPFQEWGIAAYGARDRSTAKAAYLLGRQRLGRADAMAAELGQIAVADGDYASAAREWIQAIVKVPGYRGTALAVLNQVPPANRPNLLRELAANGAIPAERLASSLMIRWGEPLAAVKRLGAALPSGGQESIDALQELLQELVGLGTPDHLMARATALELLSDRVTGPQRARIRLDAAQAFADGGDQVAARRMLGTLAGDPAATAAMSASASSTLVGVLVDEGGIQEADKKFRELAPLLGADDRQRLALRLAQGWIRSGRLGRADTLLMADSSVDASAVRGRIALYRGDLASARAQLTEAGPFTGDRTQATERIGILGLLQILEEDSLPELGDALYRLERRDSAGAATALEKLAPGLPPDHGGAELILLAGRVRLGMGQKAEAEKLFRSVVDANVAATSPAAEFALADLLLKASKKDQAIAALEHLLVTWPTSSVVPQARRLLDVARGAVPAS